MIDGEGHWEVGVRGLVGQVVSSLEGYVRMLACILRDVGSHGGGGLRRRGTWTDTF